MNTDRHSGLALVAEVLNGLPYDLPCEVVIAPPFTLLGAASDLLHRDGRMMLAAQNCHHETEGAFTGEVSAAMLASFGVNYVIVGHSERRQYFGETDALICQKMKQALQVGLGTIWCCGETLVQRDANQHFDVVEQQLTESFANLPLDHIDSVVVAYEPVWAIGTGRTASSLQAQEMHAFIRTWLTNNLPKGAADIPILYGGSVKPENAQEMFAQPDIDGGLIGGASLKAADFLAIVRSFQK